MTRHPLAETARRGLLRASDATLRLSAPLRMQPDFLIVGGQRCGTTSLFKTLAQHSGVARPFLRKGVHYFDTSYDEGPAWYRGHFPVAATSRLRRGGRRALTGESSPYYMFHPLAAERIARDLPGAKLLALVRDPVERAYSAHAHESARGFETETFERALELEPERLAGARELVRADPTTTHFSLQHHAYVERGHYAEHLRRVEALVGRERLHVVDSQDFFDEPVPVFREVLDFLGLPEQPGIRFEQHNARRRSPMAGDLRKSLEEHFAPHDEALARWWGRTPSWRR
ncbi:sulfotransferase [uncultured Pseudokineococcus sp.]|uniref:sulfotransferase n=1 Tax=uncultured Pseudokineococcus sp. TaxID=1642928 RepID=UPI00260B31B4|nr:sulfotransferase [uncultured Pseudokineococcus sp.]